MRSALGVFLIMKGDFFHGTNVYNTAGACLLPLNQNGTDSDDRQRSFEHPLSDRRMG